MTGYVLALKLATTSVATAEAASLPARAVVTVCAPKPTTTLPAPVELVANNA